MRTTKALYVPGEPELLEQHRDRECEKETGMVKRIDRLREDSSEDCRH